MLAGLDALVRDQIMSMKTTSTPGHYRRRVAGALARRLAARLFAGDVPTGGVVAALPLTGPTKTVLNESEFT